MTLSLKILKLLGQSNVGQFTLEISFWDKGSFCRILVKIIQSCLMIQSLRTLLKFGCIDAQYLDKRNISQFSKKNILWGQFGPNSSQPYIKITQPFISLTALEI